MCNFLGFFYIVVCERAAFYLGSCGKLELIPAVPAFCPGNILIKGEQDGDSKSKRK